LSPPFQHYIWGGLASLILQNQFSGDISPIFARSLKIILSLNSANFSTLDRMLKYLSETQKPKNLHRLRGKPPFWGSGSVHVRNFPNFSRQQRPRPLPRFFYGFATEIVEIRCITGVMVHFSCYEKRSRFRFRLAWSSPCTDRGQTERTSLFRATTDLRQISSRSVDIWVTADRSDR